MKTKLTIGAALAVLAAVIIPLKVWASCGCTYNIVASGCPLDGSAPIYWHLSDKNYNVKPWPNWNQPVPVANGDMITVLYNTSCCPSGMGAGQALWLFYTTCPNDGVHFTTQQLPGQCNGVTWTFHSAGCGTNTPYLTITTPWTCGGQ